MGCAIKKEDPNQMLPQHSNCKNKPVKRCGNNVNLYLNSQPYIYLVLGRDGASLGLSYFHTLKGRSMPNGDKKIRKREKSDGNCHLIVRLNETKFNVIREKN